MRVDFVGMNSILSVRLATRRISTTQSERIRVRVSLSLIDVASLDRVSSSSRDKYIHLSAQTPSNHDVE
jgi:hypothetical protein